jgi:hypothetical protein
VSESDAGFLWVSTTTQNYFMALSEVGFVMHHCDCPELLYGPGSCRLVVGQYDWTELFYGPE